MFSFVKQSFKLIQSNKTVFYLTITGILTLSGQYFLESIYQPYFKDFQVPPYLIGLSLSLGTILNIILIKYSYLLEKYFTLGKIILYINLILGIFYIALGVFVSPIFIVGIFICLYGLFNLQNPIISDYINGHTPSHIRTTVLSSVSFSRRFFQ